MRIITSIILSITALWAMGQNNQLFFQMPIVPDSLTTLQQRSDFLMEHYWDFCDLKKAFSSKPKMEAAFDTYLSIMPYSSATAAHKSVETFLKKLEKQPKDLLFIAELAESKLYSDTAEYRSDEIYLPFVRAVVNNGKVDKNLKPRYEHQLKLLTNSQPGAAAQKFDFVDRNGETLTFEPKPGVITILYFSDPDCTECAMARLRLDADINTTRLIEKGMVEVVCITPDEPSDEWREKAQRYPETWTVGASEEIDDKYEIREMPTFYLINESGLIHIKNAELDYIITIMELLSNQQR